ncbi:S9 family peptidase [Glaciihabitans sp. dw_435]|uniref:alpha/beta hydrolase family protein n=1 Tax=Glaciihabitans sp. dw_435 TaxID=2720081 RepID=UPI001BD358EA|nr:alpha/beta fold hydrolase [Glaciihabitans sp. dw_435]
MNPRHPRHFSARRVIGTSAIGVGALVAFGTAAAAVTSVAVARLIVVPSGRHTDDVRVLAVTEDTITLSSTADTRLPGRYGFWFTASSGHAKLGEILSSTPVSVTRELLSVDFGRLDVARRGRFGGWFYLSPRELDVPYSNVLVPTPVGPAPAWLIPADEDTGRWVIGVHGRGVRRAETLRAVDVFRRAGYSILLVSYRNDGDAPSSDDGRYGLGDTEWQDVDAALSYAIAQGATDVVLLGYSMGGATVLQTAIRSENAGVIRGLVLDSPVIDWITALRYQGTSMKLIEPLQRLSLAIISSTWGRAVTGLQEPIDLVRLNLVARSGELTVPVLLMHSVDDGFIPATASRALAEARPDVVEYHEFTVARHIKLWNYDPERWTAAVEGWLRRLPQSSARTGRSRRRPAAATE